MLSEPTKPMAAPSKAAMIEFQHALAAAIARVKALAEKERRKRCFFTLPMRGF